jgi:hypothetical protein
MPPSFSPNSVTPIGSGLHPKVKQEKGLATDQLNKREFNKLGFGPKVLAKIKNLSIVSAGALDDWVGLLVLPCA